MISSNCYPKDWELTTLESISSRIGDGLHGTPKYVDSSQFVFINGNNLNGRSIEIGNNVKFVSEEEYLRNQKNMNAQTVLVSINGTIGNLALYDSEKVMLGKSACYINLLKEVYRLFIYYQLQTRRVSIFWDNELSGTTIKNLGLAGIRKTPIYLPPLPVQKKIASILSTVDEAIQNVKSQIERTTALKKGLMQRLFSEGIGHTEFKESKLGRIPKEWEVVSLGKLSSRIGDGLHGTPKYVDTSDFAFINGNNLNGERIELKDNSKFVSEHEYNSNQKSMSLQTILVSINGTIGNLALYQGEKVMLGKSACYINLNEGVLREYVYYQLQTRRISIFWDNELSGTTIKNLGLAGIRKTPIVLPSGAEQQKIVDIFLTIDKKLKSLKSELELRIFEKKGLMQKLLTGEVRVKIKE